MTWGRLRAAALAALVAALSAARLAADPRSGITPPDYPQIGLPDAAAAAGLLDQFRQAGFADGGCYLEFTLGLRPRRGPDHVFRGRLWGGTRGGANWIRISLTDPEGGAPREYLLRNGPKPEAWSCQGGSPEPLPGAALLEPLIGSINLAPFDLQMPYLFWPDARVAALNRVHGRPCYAYIFRPPADFAAAHPELGAVRAFIDTEYDRPLQVETIGSDGTVRKTLSLVDLKKVRGRWMLYIFDVRDEATRDYTRFELTAVAPGAEAPPSAFDPAGLGAAAPSPPEREIIRLDR